MSFELSVDFLEPQQLNPDDPLLVYLPGMDGTGRLLHRQSKALTARFDLRCLSLRVDNYSSWQNLADDTIALIEAELKSKTNQEVYLCGESFGGCLALKTALAAKDTINKLILINPASSFNQLPILGWGADITSWIPSWIHRYSALGLLPFLAQLHRIQEGDRELLVKSMKALPPYVISWRLSLLRDFSVLDQELRSLDIPSLIIAGGADDLLPSVKEAQRLDALLPQSQMRILPQSGHACLLETDVNLDQILVKENFIPHEYALCST
ncbi:MAG: alpha/beta hydrolase [Cyanobacteria bacterium J06621_8]